MRAMQCGMPGRDEAATGLLPGAGIFGKPDISSCFKHPCLKPGRKLPAKLPAGWAVLGGGWVGSCAHHGEHIRIRHAARELALCGLKRDLFEHHTSSRSWPEKVSRNRRVRLRAWIWFRKVLP